LGTVAYHFRALQRLGLIEVSAQIPRRGAIEYVYQLTASTNGGAERSLVRAARAPQAGR
jgi:hypothetical protein